MKTLTYPGDLVVNLTNRVLGPDGYGGFVVVETATYDPERHKTTAEVRPVGPAEMRQVSRDEFGQLVLDVEERR